MTELVDRLAAVTLWPTWAAHATLCGLAVTAARLVDTLR